MHVLLPIDNDTNRAMATGELVASIPTASETVQVTIVNVQKKRDLADMDGSSLVPEEVFDKDDFPENVEKVENFLKNEGISVEKRRVLGKPAKEIIEMANEIPADLIVLSGRKRTPIGKVLFGSVTQSVLLNADTPVTVVPS